MLLAVEECHQDNRYEGRYYPRHPNGKRIYINVYAKTEEECEIKLAELIKEMRK